MENILNIIGTVLLLSFLVIIHELGHYWAAKRNGIKVHEFGIGFPPKLFKFKRGDTEWCINLIPFGGYVKLHGEDMTDPDVLKDKKSFASKKPWQKLEVILAGVFMNFMVFWILMTIAIWSGIDPVITNESQYKAAFNQGYYKMKPGVVVESAESDAVIQGDYLIAVDSVPVNSIEQVLPVINKEYGDIKTLTFQSADATKTTNLEVVSFKDEVTYYPLTSVPVFEVVAKSESGFLSQYLEVGDKVVSVNDNPVFDLNAFLTSFEEPAFADNNHVIEVVRNGQNLTLNVPAYSNQFVVDQVLPDSPAAKGGLRNGDKIIAVDGLIVGANDMLSDIVKNKGLETVVYTVSRVGQEQPIDLVLNPDENGLVGVMLTTDIKLTDFGVDFRKSVEVGSVYKVKKYSESLIVAPFAALELGYEIGISTVKAFVGTIVNLITNFKVSEEVGGPVQVAKLSYYFVGKGGVELLNFMALISLSLAVINILPIPALDGGRFLFVLIEALRGKPLNPKFEAVVHTLGFLGLMALILIISIFDIIRL
jgi:regulator of sigma E protease